MSNTPPDNPHDPFWQATLLAAGVPGSELRYDPTNDWLVSAAGLRKLIAEGVGTREGRVMMSRVLADVERQSRTA